MTLSSELDADLTASNDVTVLGGNDAEVRAVQNLRLRATSGSVQLSAATHAVVQATQDIQLSTGRGVYATIAEDVNATVQGNVRLSAGSAIESHSNGPTTVCADADLLLSSAHAANLRSAGVVELQSDALVHVDAGTDLITSSSRDTSMTASANMTLTAADVVEVATGGGVVLSTLGGVAVTATQPVDVQSDTRIELSARQQVAVMSYGDATVDVGGDINASAVGSMTSVAGTPPSWLAPSLAGSHAVVAAEDSITLGSGGAMTVRSGGTMKLRTDGPMSIEARSGLAKTVTGTHSIVATGDVSVSTQSK